MSAGIDITPEDFLHINFTTTEYGMEKAGYDWTEYSFFSVMEYVAEKSDINGTVRVCIRYNSANDTAYVRGEYDPKDGMPASLLSERKELIRKDIEEVARICGINVDTGNIVWTIEYEPLGPIW